MVEAGLEQIVRGRSHFEHTFVKGDRLVPRRGRARVAAVVSVDAHRSKEVAHVYQQGSRALVAQGKPVAITEFGRQTTIASINGPDPAGGSPPDLPSPCSPGSRRPGHEGVASRPRSGVAYPVGS